MSAGILCGQYDSDSEDNTDDDYDNNQKLIEHYDVYVEKESDENIKANNKKQDEDNSEDIPDTIPSEPTVEELSLDNKGTSCLSEEIKLSLHDSLKDATTNIPDDSPVEVHNESPTKVCGNSQGQVNGDISSKVFDDSSGECVRSDLPIDIGNDSSSNAHNESSNDVAKFQTVSNDIPDEGIPITEFFQSDFEVEDKNDDIVVKSDIKVNENDIKDNGNDVNVNEISEIDDKVNDFLAEINAITPVEVVQEPENLDHLTVDMEKSDSDDSVDEIAISMKKPIEPKSAWKNVLDNATQRYYFWNNLTNVVQWTEPQEYSDYLLHVSEYKLAKKDFKEHRKHISGLLEDRKLRREDRRKRKIQIKLELRNEQRNKEELHKKQEQLREEDNKDEDNTEMHLIGPREAADEVESCDQSESSKTVPSGVNVLPLVDYQEDTDTYDDIDSLLQMHLESKKKELEILNSHEITVQTDTVIKDSKISDKKIIAEESIKQTTLFSECNFDDEFNLLNKLKKMSTLINDKLTFFELDTKEISKIKILQIQLKTRFEDWRKGEIQNSYLLKCLNKAICSIEKFESEIAPMNWALHWNSVHKSYFYKNTKSGKTTWSFPKETEQDVKESKEPLEKNTPIQSDHKNDDELYDYAMQELDGGSVNTVDNITSDSVVIIDDITTDVNEEATEVFEDGEIVETSKDASVICAKPQTYEISSPPGPPQVHKSKKKAQKRNRSNSPKKSSKKNKKKHRHHEVHGSKISKKKNLSTMVEKWQKVAEDI